MTYFTDFYEMYWHLIQLIYISCDFIHYILSRLFNEKHHLFFKTFKIHVIYHDLLLYSYGILYFEMLMTFYTITLLYFIDIKLTFLSLLIKKHDYSIILMTDYLITLNVFF